MAYEFTQDDVTYILTQFRDRLVAAENTIDELKSAVELLNYVTLVQQRTIMSLQDELTPEALSVLATMEDSQLYSASWQSVPDYVAFTRELEEVLAGRKSAC